MQGIGPGSLLGGRYTADRRTAQYAGAERWTARDTTLDRAVVLFTVPRSHPNVDAVLDAARRSAGLDNSRLSRILDVGTDDDVAYVVEESLDGSLSLATLLSRGPLSAPEVRRIAGETALVLDLARHRGLHHQQLTPDLVLRTSDGDVKVRGLATMAALVGVDDVDGQTAARADAMAVVAIAYAGFTGHWPLPGNGGGLPPAPRVGAHVVAPSEIAVGVPADLDALCRLTFANNQGPVTPGDFARQIAPWSPIPVLLPSLDASEQSEVSHSGGWTGGGSPARDAVAGQEPARQERSGPAPQSSATGTTEGSESEASEHEGSDLQDSDLADHPPTHEGERTDAQHDKPWHDDSDAERATGSPAGHTTAPSPRSGGAPVPVARRVPAPTPPGGRGVPATKPSAAKTSAPGAAAPKGGSKPDGPTPVAAMTAATTAALGSAGAATVSAARGLSDRLSGLSSSTRDRARVAVDDVRARREESAARSAQTAEASSESLSARPGPSGPAFGVRERDRDALEPPVPLLPASAAEPLSRDQSRMAIGIIVGFLVLALVLAMWGLSRIPSLPTLGDEGVTPAPTATPTATDAATDAATEPPEDAPVEVPAAGAALTFAAASDYDPLGDGAESPEELPNILDGDDSTAWTSEGYQSPSFGGLKTGVGVVLDLGETTSVSEVALVLPSESAGSIYVTDDEGYASAGTPLAEDLPPAGTFDGSDTVTIPLAEGTSGRYVVVWFTEVSTGGEQWHRARLAGAGATS